MHAPYPMQTPEIDPHYPTPELPLASIKLNFFTSQIDSSVQKTPHHSDLSGLPSP